MKYTDECNRTHIDIKKDPKDPSKTVKVITTFEEVQNHNLQCLKHICDNLDYYEQNIFGGFK